MLMALLLLIGTVAGEVRAEALFNADLYLAGTNRQQLIFRQKNSVAKKDGATILTHTYTHVDGRLAAREVVTLRDGAIQRYEVTMPDTGCGCLLETAGNRIRFSYTKGGEPKTGEVDVVPDIVTGPTLTAFVHRRWASLLRGETAYFHLPAMSLQRLARFQITRIAGSPRNRPGVEVFQMKIANVFLRIAVDPVELVYDSASRRLLEIHGKSLLTRRVGGRLENPVVDIVYRYDR